MSTAGKQDLIDAFAEDLSSAQTRRAYRTDLRQILGESVGEDQVRDLTAEDIQDHVRTMHDLGRAVGTQRRQLSALRSFFDWLMTEGIHDRNPARHPDVGPVPPDEESAEAQPLTAEELAAVLQAASGSEKTSLRDRALILTIVYGALHRSEVAGLEVGDLRPLGRHWILDLDAAAGTGGAYVRIPEPLAELLERVTDVFGITKGPFWRSVSNRSYGEPLTPNGIYRIVRETGRQADLEALNINTLRRTGLNLALQGGASLSQVQAFGRYKDSSSVSDLSVPDAQRGGLSDSAAEYIDFDLKTVIESL